jgi:hypothetical protein
VDLDPEAHYPSIYLALLVGDDAMCIPSTR